MLSIVALLPIVACTAPAEHREDAFGSALSVKVPHGFKPDLYRARLKRVAMNLDARAGTTGELRVGDHAVAWWALGRHTDWGGNSRRRAVLTVMARITPWSEAQAVANRIACRTVALRRDAEWLELAADSRITLSRSDWTYIDSGEDNRTVLIEDRGAGDCVALEGDPDDLDDAAASALLRGTLAGLEVDRTALADF